MAKDNVFIIDQLLMEEMSGSDKIAALLKARGFNMSSYARHIRHWPEEVRMTIRGDRPYPQVRDAIARDFGISRAEVDHLIDASPGKAQGANDGAAKEAA